MKSIWEWLKKALTPKPKIQKHERQKRFDYAHGGMYNILFNKEDRFQHGEMLQLCYNQVNTSSNNSCDFYLPFKKASFGAFFYGSVIYPDKYVYELQKGKNGYTNLVEQ